MCFERARDRNHSRSYGEGNMCAQNASKQVAYMDVGKGREQERKLEGSPSDRPSTNCIFDKKAETIATYRFLQISSALVKNAG